MGLLLRHLANLIVLSGGLVITFWHIFVVKEVMVASLTIAATLYLSRWLAPENEGQ